MHYKAKGEGPYTFVLLHNAGGNLDFFSNQVDVLSRLGKVILIDLPGHGESAQIANPSVKLFAKEVIKLCKELSVNNIIAIGLNYGADVFIELNNLEPELILASILIDPPMFLSQEVKSLIDHNIEELEMVSGAQHAKELVGQSFVLGNKEAKDIALAAFTKMDNAYLAALYKELLLWDKQSSTRIAGITHKCLVIFTDAALCSVADIEKENKEIKTAKVVGSMYWATLEVPDQVNAMITRFFHVEIQD